MKKFLYRARLALIALLLCGALALLRLAKNAGVPTARGVWKAFKTSKPAEF